MKHSVLILQRRLPHYRTALFDRLRERLSENNIELSLVHGNPSPAEALKKDEAELTWAEKVRARYLRINKSDFVFMSLPWNLIRKQDLIIMPHENSMLVNYLLLGRRLAGGSSKLAFFGHGKNFQAGDAGEIRERLRRTLIPLVDWWFAYTQLSVQEVEAAGFDAREITCLNNAIDTAEQRTISEQISNEEKEGLLRRLGLRGATCAVFLGSLYKDKRLTFLFQAADELRQRMSDFELVIIGDGPLRDEVKKFVKPRAWTKWVGAQFGTNKVLHASLGKVMLNPGLVGLNILDSFSLGLPMVTTDCRIHSPEIAYLDNGKNGIMANDSLPAFANAAEGLFKDHIRLAAMRKQCLEDAGKYTLERMVGNFATGIESALGLIPQTAASVEGSTKGLRVVVIWQRFLPYHIARLKRLQETLAAMGHQLTAIEVASQDKTYGFPEDIETNNTKEFISKAPSPSRVEGNNTAPPLRGGDEGEGVVCGLTNDRLGNWITCFPGQVYHHYAADAIYSKVLETLRDHHPDIVFAPATPFPEGMAALMHRTESGSRVIIMDDAWERSDRRGPLTRMAKHLLHNLADGAFIPAPSHMGYYAALNIPKERIVCGVDVVDNDYYASGTDRIRSQGDSGRNKRGLPQHYFLFVGRFLKRKGIETLLDAFKEYRTLTAESAWDLVLVGDGAELETMKNRVADTRGVYFAGRRVGDELLAFYAFAEVVIVPSELDPWALVVNEAMASGLPVIVSRGVGSAQTLVKEGENGWTFEPGDSESLARLMEQMTMLSAGQLKAMGDQSRKIISEWSLDRFCQGVLEAINIPRRNDAGVLSKMAVKLWKGRVSVN